MTVRGRLSGTETVTGGTQNAWRELCRLESDEIVQGTILTSATPITQPVGAVPTPRILIRAQIGTGNAQGGAGAVYCYTLAGNPLAFSGSRVYVSALIVPIEDFIVGSHDQNVTVAPVPKTTTAKVTGSITLGSSAQIQPTIWHQPAAPLASSEQVSTSSSRLREVVGFNHGGATTYLMFFDTANGAVSVIPGSIPLFTIAVPGTDTSFSLDYIESTRVFQNGIYWACSTTADTFTADNANPCRVDIELFAQQVSAVS